MNSFVNKAPALREVQAIQKGSVDSCREAHEDWLAKVQASLAAPAHVLQGPTHSNLSSLTQASQPGYRHTTQVRFEAANFVLGIKFFAISQGLFVEVSRRRTIRQLAGQRRAI